MAMRFIAALWILCSALLVGCGGGAADQGEARAVADPAFLADNAVWREERKQELLQADGWTSLVGLHWLELKAHYIGSGPGSGIKLAMGPAKMGLVEQRDGRVYLTPESGAALSVDDKPLTRRIELRDDHDPAPVVIGFDQGQGSLSLIGRGDRRALRVKHAQAPSRVGFAGLEYWPATKDWLVEGRFVPHPPGTTIPIVDITGTSSDAPNPGAVEFVRDGKTYRLEALGEPGSALFLVMADRTSGHGSYPAGRFMDAAAPDAQGRVMLDFNRAYNPPCAFTAYATCPLPPPENRLDLAITAGEKAYTHTASSQ